MLYDSYFVVVLLSFKLSGVLSQATIEDIACSGVDNRLPMTEDWETVNMKLKELLKREQERVRELENRLAQCQDASQVNKGTDVVCENNRESTVSATFITSLDAENYDRIYGVAKGRGEIYVLGRVSRSIRVYADNSTFTHLRDISIPLVGIPHDLIFSDETNSLYIADYGADYESAIWHLTLDDTSQLTRWRRVIDLRTLSWTKEGHMLVVSKTNVEVYDLNATLVRRFELPEGIKEIRDAVQTARGSYIVTYQDTNTSKNSNGEWNLIQLSGQGCLVKHLQSKAIFQEVPEPYYMAAHPYEDLLFVADPWKYRVLLFNSRSLCWDKVLIGRPSKAGGSPFRLYYDDTKKHLFVATFGTRQTNGQYINVRVDVYEIAN